MVRIFTEEQKARRRETNRIWRENNKEKRKEQQKIWRENNKEHIVEMNRIWRENNVEHLAQFEKERNNKAHRIKSQTIGRWKSRGVIHDDWDALYEAYLQATHCAFCKNEFKDTSNKHLDHNHQTGKFRAFLCRACNLCDVFKHQT